MNDNECRDALRSLIGQELDLARQLSDALSAETDALSELDPAALDKATLVKQHCVEQLGVLDSERRALFNVFGATDDQVERFLGRIDVSGELTDNWESLLELLAACRSANQRNGIVVASQRRRVGEAIGLLRGSSTQAPTYNQSGDIADHGEPRVQART